MNIAGIQHGWPASDYRKVTVGLRTARRDEQGHRQPPWHLRPVGGRAPPQRVAVMVGAERIEEARGSLFPEVRLLVNVSEAEVAKTLSTVGPVLLNFDGAHLVRNEGYFLVGIQVDLLVALVADAPGVPEEAQHLSGGLPNLHPAPRVCCFGLSRDFPLYPVGFLHLLSEFGSDVRIGRWRHFGKSGRHRRTSRGRRERGQG